MNISSNILYAGIFFPLLLYLGLVSNILYTVARGTKAPAPALTWSKTVSVDRRKDLVLKRTEPLLAYKYDILTNLFVQMTFGMFRQCVSGKGEWYHLEHFTGDVSFRDPMILSEGHEDLSAIVTLTRSVSDRSTNINDVNKKAFCLPQKMNCNH